MAIVTAFTVHIHEDGRVVAQPVKSGEMDITRQASELDIKQACQELLDSLLLRNISRIVSSVITETQATEGQKVASSVRQSLVEKGLL